VRLQIPSIKVDAAIQYVGLTGSGSMEVPQGRADVAWYKFGPRPGDLGSAVIAGHRGRPNAPRQFLIIYPSCKRETWSMFGNLMAG
jgi:sortase A